MEMGLCTLTDLDPHSTPYWMSNLDLKNIYRGCFLWRPSVLSLTGSGKLLFARVCAFCVIDLETCRGVAGDGRTASWGKLRI